ncbi:hypothetical protein FHG87_000217 [Trinorchestia longiramus]|nr:hypothetical protein FHG87_000217 [Trinorchestia longiramus]
MLLTALSREVNVMELVVSLVAIVLLATAAAADTSENQPSVFSLIPDIRTGEFWNPRGKNSKSNHATPDQSGSKRSLNQAADVKTDNDFWKPIAEGFQTSLVQLRPVYTGTPDETKVNVKLGLNEAQKKPLSNDKTGKHGIVGLQKRPTEKEKKQPVLKSHQQKTVNKQLPSTQLPPKASQNNAFRNKHASLLSSLIKQDRHVPRFTGTPNLGQQGVFPTFNPTQLVRKGVFPPEAFLPQHPSRKTNSSHKEVIASDQFNSFGFANNVPLNSAPSSFPQFSTQPSQGREIRSKKKSVTPEQLESNPTGFNRHNSQRFAKSRRPGEILQTFDSNFNFRNVQQFAPKPVSRGRSRAERKLPGSLSENTLKTNTRVPTGAPTLESATRKNNDVKQRNNNVSNVVVSDLNSQTNSDWQGIILSEINKWASTDQTTAVKSDTSNDLTTSDVHLSVMKSIPAHKFTILDDQIQNETAIATPSTQQKRSENTITTVHHLKPMRLDETNRKPTRDFSLHLQNRAVPQQTAFTSGNIPNHVFQSRMLAPERSTILSGALLQSTGAASQSSIPDFTRHGSQSALFSIDDSFLRQFSQPGNSPRAASITSENLRQVLAQPSDSTNLGNLNALNESQKITLLQGIHKTLEEQTVNRPIRTNDAFKSLPSRPVAGPGEIKSDRNSIKKLNGRHLLGIQQISGHKHQFPTSVGEVPHSFYSTQNKNIQSIQPTKLSYPSRFSSAQRRPDSTLEPHSQKLLLDKKSLVSAQQLQNHFTHDQLTTQNLHRQLSAQQHLSRNLPRRQLAHDLFNSNFPRQPSQGKAILDFTGQKLESPHDFLQSTPRVSLRGLSHTSGRQRFPPQTNSELLNKNRSSKPVQTSEFGLPPRSERTTKPNLDIVQLKPFKLASKEVYYPWLPLEAQNALRNPSISQQDIEFPVSISTMKDGPSTSLGSSQKNLGENSAATPSRQNQVAETQASDLVAVGSSEANTLSLKETQNNLGNSKFLNDGEQILGPEIPLQRQGDFYRSHFPRDTRQFRKSPLSQSSIGRDFMRVAEPPSILDDAFSKGLENNAIKDEHLKRFPDISQLFSDHYGRAPRIAPESFNEDDEFNFSREVAKAPPTFRVPLPLQTKDSNFALKEVEQLAPVDEPEFEDYEDGTERERPSLKHSSHRYPEREPKFFPKNGYNISPFFRGFPSFGFFDKSL